MRLDDLAPPRRRILSGHHIDDPVIQNESRELKNVVFDAEEEVVLTSSNQNEIRLWNSKGAVIKDLALPWLGWLHNVTSLAMTHSKKIIVGSTAGSIRILDSEKGEVLRNLSYSKGRYPHDYCTAVLASYDEQHIISSGQLDNTLTCWDLETGTSVLEFPHASIADNRQIVDFTHKNPLSLSYDNKLIVSSHYQKIVVWDIRSFAKVRAITMAPKEIPRNNWLFKRLGNWRIPGRLGNLISTDSREIVAVNDGVHIYDVGEARLKSTVPDVKCDAGFSSVSMCANNRYITACGLNLNYIMVYDRRGGEEKRQYLDSSRVVDHVLSSGGDLVSIGPTGSVGFWNLSSIMKGPKPPKPFTFLPVPKDVELQQNWVVKTFIDVIQRRELVSAKLLADLFDDVVHIAEFKFPYTLAVFFLQEEKDSDKALLQEKIYSCLKDLIETCIFHREADQKSPSDSGVINLTNCFSLLEMVYKQGFLTQSDYKTLRRIATKEYILSDDRILLLSQELTSFKKQLEINCQNLKIVAEDLSSLKEALKKREKRNIYVNFIKVGLVFLGHGLLDFCSSVLNLSDLGQLAQDLFHVDVSTFITLNSDDLKKVLEPMAETVSRVVEDPNELYHLWIQSAVLLQEFKLEEEGDPRQILDKKLLESMPLVVFDEINPTVQFPELKVDVDQLMSPRSGGSTITRRRNSSGSSSSGSTSSSTSSNSSVTSPTSAGISSRSPPRVNRPIRRNSTTTPPSPHTAGPSPHSGGVPPSPHSGGVPPSPHSAPSPTSPTSPRSSPKNSPTKSRTMRNTVNPLSIRTRRNIVFPPLRGSINVTSPKQGKSS